MKTTFALLAVGASIAAAQDLSQLPACGQTCVGNMLGQAQALGCSASDYGCLCKNTNFGYGVRDCSNEACPNASDAAAVIAFGTAFCAQFAGASASVGTTGALPVLSSALATASGASSLLASASGAVGSAASTAVTTSPLVQTVVSDGQTQLQTTGFKTIYGPLPIGSLTDSAGSVIASATDSAGSVIASATDSAGSVIASATDSAGSLIASATDSAGSLIVSATDSAGSAIASATDSAGSLIASATDSAGSLIASATGSAGSAINSATGAAGSAVSSATGGAASTGGAPMVTGLPLAGAAGMAALLLL